MGWFDICIYFEMITTITLLLPHSYPLCVFMCVVRALRIYCYIILSIQYSIINYSLHAVSLYPWPISAYFPSPPALETSILFSISVSQTFFIKMSEIMQYLPFFVWLISLSKSSRFIHVAINGRISSFYGWIIFHCTYIPCFLYPFIHLWTLRLFPHLGYCE